MSVIKHILNEELERLQKLQQKYINEIKELPKGSISKKKRNEKVYLYWAFRDKEKIKFQYIGKENSKEAVLAFEQKDKKNKYIDLLKKVQKDIKEIQRSVNGKRG
jgi:hypothetical protein